MGRLGKERAPGHGQLTQNLKEKWRKKEKREEVDHLLAAQQNSLSPSRLVSPRAAAASSPPR
eukprot:scaffold13436_cov14-Tisochrysis_lutea.AAC.1